MRNLHTKYLKSGFLDIVDKRGGSAFLESVEQACFYLKNKVLTPE